MGIFSAGFLLFVVIFGHGMIFNFYGFLPQCDILFVFEEGGWGAILGRIEKIIVCLFFPRSVLGIYFSP